MCALEKPIVGAIVQGITEMLPIASGYHLKLLGISDIECFHLATSLTALLYSFIFQRKALRVLFWSILQLTRPILYYSRLLPFIIPGFIAVRVLMGHNPYFSASILIVPMTILITRFINKPRLRNLMLVLLGFIISIVILLPSLVYLLSSVPYSCLGNDALILIANGFILICLEVSNLKGQRATDDFRASDLVWSLFGNCLGLISGASRLGSVYLILRLRGFEPKSAIKLAWVQSIFAILLFLFQPKRILLPLVTVISCVLHFGMMHLILNLKSHRVKQLICICGIYRIFLGFIGFMR